MLLQTSRGRGPQPLEMYVGIEGPDEFHFYARGVTFQDFITLYGNSIRRLDVLIYRMPPDLLNPNFWEPLTKEAENAVREKMTGILTRTEGGQTLLWRSDRVARSRLLRDGLDAEIAILSGYIFRASGEDLIKLGREWNGRGRFEWAGLAVPEGVDLPPETLSVVHNDLTQLRRSLPEAEFLFATADDDQTRIIFGRRADLDVAVSGLVRGFVHGATGKHLAALNPRVCGQIIQLADGLGFSAAPEADLIDKGRTIEVNVTQGRTPWGVALRPGQEPLAGDERILIYYDCISGLWAVSS